MLVEGHSEPQHCRQPPNLSLYYEGKVKQTIFPETSHIKGDNNSPRGKFHQFLFPFSNKFPDLNFTPYVLYIYSCYETVCDTNSEPGLPVIWPVMKDSRKSQKHSWRRKKRLQLMFYQTSQPPKHPEKFQNQLKCNSLRKLGLL